MTFYQFMAVLHCNDGRRGRVAVSVRDEDALRPRALFMKLCETDTLME